MLNLSLFSVNYRILIGIMKILIIPTGIIITIHIIVAHVQKSKREEINMFVIRIPIYNIIKKNPSSIIFHGGEYVYLSWPSFLKRFP